jgi:hypothetical protein
MPTQKKRSTGLGAATDDPRRIFAVAREELPSGREDTLRLRQAANKAWLATCSAADVAAHHLGMRQPTSRSTRQAALREVERCARLHTRSLLSRFDDVQRHLHGECFHDDECPSDIGVWFDTAEGLIEDTLSALGRCRLKRRKSR